MRGGARYFLEVIHKGDSYLLLPFLSGTVEVAYISSLSRATYILGTQNMAYRIQQFLSCLFKTSLCLRVPHLLGSNLAGGSAPVPGSTHQSGQYSGTFHDSHYGAHQLLWATVSSVV